MIWARPTESGEDALPVGLPQPYYRQRRVTATMCARFSRDPVDWVTRNVTAGLHATPYIYSITLAPRALHLVFRLVAQPQYGVSGTQKSRCRTTRLNALHGRWSMAKQSVEECRALVTGASSGIGRAIACELARRHARLILLARRRQRLEELAAEVATLGAQAQVVAGDVTDPTIRQQAVELAAEKFGGLDVLVNNAGAGALGLFSQVDAQQMRRVMEVNFFAVVEMTRAALPLLRESPRAIVVNIGSVLGHRAAPHYTAYCASKFALRGFNQSLRVELEPEGIDVLLVSPGATKTEFTANLLETVTQPAWPEHRRLGPEVVARQTVRAMERRRREIIPYFWGRCLVWLDRLCPALGERLMKRIR